MSHYLQVRVNLKGVRSYSLLIYKDNRVGRKGLKLMTEIPLDKTDAENLISKGVCSCS